MQFLDSRPRKQTHLFKQEVIEKVLRAMANCTFDEAVNALTFLAEVAAERESENARFNYTFGVQSSDEEAGSLSLYFDEFYLNRGSESILKLKNITANALEKIWSNLE